MTTLYFARISRSKPKLAKRPNAWANCDAQVELFSQLCCIASDCSRITVETSQGEIHGVTSWPDTESMRTTFAPIDPDTTPPQPGETINIIAQNRRVNYQYETQVLAIDELNRWVLASPAFITSYDRRALPRHAGRGWRVILRRMGNMGQDISANVLDISIGGLSILVPQDGFRLQRHDPMWAYCLDPAARDFPCERPCVTQSPGNAPNSPNS